MNRRGALLGVASVALAPSVVGAADPQSLRLGFDPIESNCNVYVAQAEGMFSRAGIAVDAQRTHNGAAGAAAVASGSLDVTTMNVASLAGALQRGLPFVVVALGEMYTSKSPTTQVLVRSNFASNGVRDLQGKTLAVATLSGLGNIAARLWLDQNGVDPQSVSIIEMPFAVMPAALSAERVDAIFVAEPDLSAAKRQGARVYASPYDVIGSEFLIGASVAERSWALQNADLVRRFGGALHQASIFANHHHDQTAVVVSTVVQQDVAAIRAQTRATFPENQRATTLLQPVFDAFAKSGHVATPVNAGDVISADLAR